MKISMAKHHDWVHQVGCDILKQKKLSLEDYLNTVLQSGVPWDELAILIFVRMYKIHILFFMSGNKFWSSNFSRKRDDCQIMLMYRGRLTFSDTVRKADMQQYRLEHPMPPPPPRDPTPPPHPHEETPSS